MQFVQDFNKANLDIFRGLSYYRIWTYLATADVFAKYRRSLLGPLWVSSSMLASAIALSIVFGGIFHQKLEDVLPYIMAGFLAWGFLGLLFGEGCESYVSVAGIIKSTPFPFTLHIYRMVLKNVIIFGHNLAVFGVVKLFLTHSLLINIQIIPGIIIAILFVAFTCGLTGMFSARFRDLRFLLPSIGQIAFMVTPIFWRPAQLIQSSNDIRQLIYAYNPFYYLIRCVRDPLLGLSVPLDIWITSGLTTVVVGVSWWAAFAVSRKRIAFWV